MFKTRPLYLGGCQNYAYENEYSPHFQQGFPQNGGKTSLTTLVEKNRNGDALDEKQVFWFVKGVFEYSFGLVFNKMLKTVLEVVNNTKTRLHSIIRCLPL